jgi:hypothetical protein
MTVVIESEGHALGFAQMVSTQTGLYAFEDKDPGWSISYLPNRVFDRNQAVSAMTIAEHVAEHWHDAVEPLLNFGKPYCEEGCPRWPFIVTWAHELGITGETAVIAVGAFVKVMGRVPGAG